MTPNFEWAVGISMLPSYVMDGAVPYRPAIILVVDAASRYVLAADLVTPSEVIDAIPTRLAALATRGIRPQRLRVASAELAGAVRGAIADAETVVGPTPELDEVMASFLEHSANAPSEVTTYLEGDLTAEHLARFFAGTARLYRTQPWTVLPPDAPITVDCPALGISEGLLVVVGQMRESFGLAIFPDRAAFDALTRLADAPNREPIPAQVVLHFDTREDVGPALVAEVRRFKWQLAGPAAYPSAMRFDGDGGARPLTAVEIVGLTEVAEALAELVSNAPQLHRAWSDRPATEHLRGDVRLVAPAPLPAMVAHEPREPALADLVRRSLRTKDGTVDEGVCRMYLDVIAGGFARSAEARHVDPALATPFLEDTAFVLGATLVELTPDQVRDLVFAAMPRSVVAQAHDAPAIIAAIRALLAFAARELGGYGSNWCLNALPDDAVELLATELADPSNYGPAKAFFMQGVAAGYDMATEEGVAAWTDAHNRAMRGASSRKRAPVKTKNKPKKPSKRS